MIFFFLKVKIHESSSKDTRHKMRDGMTLDTRGVHGLGWNYKFSRRWWRGLKLRNIERKFPKIHHMFLPNENIVWYIYSHNNGTKVKFDRLEGHLNAIVINLAIIMIQRGMGWVFVAHKN